MLRLALMLLMTSLTAFSAFLQVRLPFLSLEVPSLPDAEEVARWHGLVFGYHVISTQILMVWLTGAVLGPWRGLVSVGLYLLLGLQEVYPLPIFTYGGGMRYVAEPTFGYLLCFLPAVVLSGASHRATRLGPIWWSMALALLVIDLGGVTYQYFALAHLDKPSPWLALFHAQVVQFLPGQLTLLTVAALVVTVVRLFGRLFRLSGRSSSDAPSPLLPPGSSVPGSSLLDPSSPGSPSSGPGTSPLP